MECEHKIRLSTGYVPCGKCVACTINKSQDWITRLIFEDRNSTGTIFFTLTYNDEHLKFYKKVPIVNKSDVQRFVQNVRNKVGRGVRYYIVAEYGPSSLRPHYHGLFFNWPHANDRDTSLAILHMSWYNEGVPMGFVSCDPVTLGRISYVARYSALLFDLPEFYHKFPAKPFQLMSRRPGIGIDFITPGIVDKMNNDPFTQVHLMDGSVARLPRYYKDKLIADGRIKRKINDDIRKISEERIRSYNERYGQKDSLRHSHCQFVPLRDTNYQIKKEKLIESLRKRKNKL